MKPLKFKEATKELKKPSSMSDKECGSLFIYEDGNTCISLWSTSFWNRLKFLFHGKIWLGVYSGSGSQPPVWLDCTKTVFIKK